MIRERDGRLIATMYDSVADIRESVKTIRGEKNRSVRDFALDNTRFAEDPQEAQEWLGAPSVAEVERRMERGWPEGAARLSELSAREVTATSVRRRRFRSDQGDEIDMQSVWRGDLSRAWTRTRRESRFGPRTVTLVCNLSCTFGVTADEMLWRGVSALKVAETLSEAGYAVQIIAGCGAKSTDSLQRIDVAQFVEVKALDAPLDVSALAAYVVMPGFKRVWLHAARGEVCEWAGSLCSSSLGVASFNVFAKGARMLPISENAFLQPEVNDAQAAQEWIDKVLAEIESPQQIAA